MTDFLATQTAIAATALLAAGASGWLWRRTAGGRGLPGCGAGSGCDAVLRSRWSRWGPLPVAAPATALYVLAFLAAAASLPATSAALPAAAREAARPALLAAGAIAAGSAVWFTGLQLLGVRRVCSYCTAVHAAGLLMAGLIAWQARAEWEGGRREASLTTGLVLAAGTLAFLIGGQLFLKPRRYAISAPPTSAGGRSVAMSGGLPGEGKEWRPSRAGDGRSGPEGPGAIARETASKPDPEARPAPEPAARPLGGGRRVRAYGGRVNLALKEWPMLGLPSAEYVAVFLFDYTCGECRHLRRLLVPAVTGFAGRLAVLMVPVPLDPACNPAVTAANTDRRDACGYARLGWALWRTDPLAYASFDDWVFGPPCAPPLGEALAVAQSMAPGARLAAGEPDATADARLADAAAIYRALEGQPIPALLFPNTALRGHVESVGALVELIEHEMKLKLTGAGRGIEGVAAPVARVAATKTKS